MRCVREELRDKRYKIRDTIRSDKSELFNRFK